MQLPKTAPANAARKPRLRSTIATPVENSSTDTCKRQARGKHEAGKRQEARGKRQEARGKRQEARGKRPDACDT
jgi:hypothetical protein